MHIKARHSSRSANVMPHQTQMNTWEGWMYLYGIFQYLWIQKTKNS